MKKLIDKEITKELSFDEYKQIIDDLIANKKLNKLKLQPNYFEITNNYWIIDKYIAKNGQFSPDVFPNTLDTYSQAIKLGYALCIPVHILDDDNIVCFSHKNISKVVPTTSGYLNKFSLDELKEVSLNDRNEKVPTLEEALNHIANKTPIIIEIHNEGMVGKMEDKILSLLQKYISKYNCHSRVAIMSINPYTLQYCYQQFPYITRILKSGNFAEKMFGSLPTRKLKNLKLYKITMADFICYSSELLPSRLCAKCKPVGVIAYNVTNQNHYIKVAPYCDNIIFSHFKPTI